MFRKNVFFDGNLDRLHRCVRREKGKLLKNQRFTMILKSKKVRRLSAIPFCFRCRFQKCENGYHILYYLIPAWSHFLWFLLAIAIVGVYAYYRQWDFFVACGLFTLLCVPSYFIQRSQCILLFEAICQK